MAFSVGAVVANIYYIQPLLATIAGTFRISVPKVGTVAMLTQFGAAAGMLMFVPLGDTKERRRLIVSLLGRSRCAWRRWRARRILRGWRWPAWA